MKALATLTDPVYIPRENFTWYDKLWLRIMNDKRDLPFIYLLTVIHLSVSQLYFKGRFGLMFHCICHRKCFKKPFQWIHGYITWIVCPLFGHAPEGYFSHHMGMHHIENNMEDDTSSTMAYQRDSAKDFLAYFFKFLFVGVKNTIL